MTTAIPKLDELSDTDRAALESWLAEFDQSWDDASFVAKARSFPDSAVNWWVAALLEMVKIELERRSECGQVPQVEDYVEVFFAPGQPIQLEAAGDIKRALLCRLAMIDLEFHWQTNRVSRTRTDGNEPRSETRNPFVEDYVARFPELCPAIDLQLELAGHEYRVRRRCGDTPRQEEYFERFGDLAGGLPELLKRIDSELGIVECASTHSFVPQGEDTVANHDAEPRRVSARTPQIPGYEIIGELGHGGMGVVYKARQLGLKRLVALKMIISGGYASDQELARFQLEAEAVARLQHVNIVQIYDIGQHDGRPFFSMEFVEGSSLAVLVRSEPQPCRWSAEIVEKLARATHAAHQRGIVHRDLKPANVLLTVEHEPKISDFGLAKHLDRDDSERTATGTVMGTPAYMAPEQAGGRVNEIGPQSDVYSLGAILYCLLSGRPPFQSASPTETIKQVMEREPVALRQLIPDVNRDLETIVLKCLDKDRSRRFETADHLADELRRYLQGEPIRSRRTSRVVRASRWCRRKPWAAASIGLALVLLLSLGVAGGLVRETAQGHRLSRLSSRFQVQLDRAELSPKELESLDFLVAEIGAVSSADGQAARRRLHAHFASLVDAASRQPKLEAPDIARIEAVIPMLDEQPLEWRELSRASLGERRVEWRNVFELVSPFTNLETVFARGEMCTHNTQLEMGSRADARKNGRVLTQIACQGRVQCEAVFDEAWETSSELGLVLEGSLAGHDGQFSGYDFVVRAAEAGASDSPEVQASSFAAVRARGGFVIVEILRNGARLQRRHLPVSEIRPGPLRLRAERDRDKLKLQIEPLKPLEFYDPFALNVESGVFGLKLLGPVSLTEFRASRKTEPVRESGLETADHRYDSRDFAGAFGLYAAEAVQTSQNEFRQEAHYKQALCLLALSRADEAAQLLERLMIESGDRWSPMAGCQLWLLRLRQKRAAEADAVFQALRVRYQFDQLAAFIPSADRDEILNGYLSELNTLSKLLRYNPRRLRNIEQAAAVDRFLSPDGKGHEKTIVQLMRAYEYAGETARAMELAEVLVRTTRATTGYAHLTRLLRLSGNPQRARDEMNLAVAACAPDSPDRFMLLVSRAFAHAAVHDWTAVKNDVDETVRTATYDSAAVSRAWLMKGLLCQRSGDPTQAAVCWRKGLEIARRIRVPRGEADRHLLVTSILVSLCDDSAVAFASDIFAILNGGIGHQSILTIVMATVSPEAVATAIHGAWRSPRGRELIDAIAFDKISMSDSLRLPILLVGVEGVRQISFQGDLDANQEATLWEAAGGTYDGFLTSGRLSIGQAAQLMLAWKGTLNSLGWAGVAPLLEPKLRSGLAYVMAHRLLLSHDKLQAKAFLRAALKDAPPGAPGVQAAQTDLDLLEAGNGRILVNSEVGDLVEVEIRQGGQHVATVKVEKTSQVELPAGVYEMSLVKPRADFQLVPGSIELAVTGRCKVAVLRRWKPIQPEYALPGLVAGPAAFEKLGPWQVTTIAPRGDLRAVTWHPQLPLVAAAGEEGPIRLYHPDTGKLLGLMVGHSRRVTSAAWSREGRHLASGSEDQTVRTWKVDGLPKSVLLGHTAGVTAVAWHPKGAMIASGGYDKTLRLWNLDAAGRLLAAHSDSILCLAWRPDGSQLASGSSDGGVRTWNTDGKLHSLLKGSKEAINAVTWSPDGHDLAAGGAGIVIWRWDEAGKVQPALRGHSKAITTLAWDPHGSWLASGGWDGSLRLWKAAGVAGPIAKDSGFISPSWSPDGKQLASAGHNGSLYVWPVQGAPRRIAQSAAFIYAMSWSPDGRRIAVGGAFDGAVRLWDAKGKVGTRLRGHTSAAWALAWRPDGRTLASAAFDGTVRLWDAAGKPGPVLKGHNGRVTSLAWRPDGSQLASVGADSTLRIWNVDGTARAVLSGHTGYLKAVAWSADGQTVASAGDDSTVRLWNCEGVAGPVFKVSRGAVEALAWSRDGRLAGGCADWLVRLWRADGTALPALKGHSGSIRTLAWSPDGRALASAGSDSTVRLWQADGAPGRVLRGETGSIAALTWSPDGTRLAVGGNNGTFRIWNVTTGEQEWTSVDLPGGEAIVFGSGGQILDATPQADKYLVYYVDRPDRAIELLTPAAFRERLSKIDSRQGQQPVDSDSDDEGKSRSVSDKSP